MTTETTSLRVWGGCTALGCLSGSPAITTSYRRDDVFGVGTGDNGVAPLKLRIDHWFVELLFLCLLPYIDIAGQHTLYSSLDKMIG